MNTLLPIIDMNLTFVKIKKLGLELRCTKLSNMDLNPSVFFKNIFLIIYFWLCWVFVTVHGLSLVVQVGATL